MKMSRNVVRIYPHATNNLSLFYHDSIMIQYIKGDLFSHKPSPGRINILVHACNCKGSWGAGVAAKFRQEYPQCYKVHQQYCNQFSHESSQLLGTSQIMDSVPSEPGHKSSGPSLIVCLFTSDFFGNRKLDPADIVNYTKLSLYDLQTKLNQYHNYSQLDTKDGKIVLNMPKINAGLFGVPWPHTEAVLAPFDFHYNVYVL